MNFFSTDYLQLSNPYHFIQLHPISLHSAPFYDQRVVMRSFRLLKKFPLEWKFALPCALVSAPNVRQRKIGVKREKTYQVYQ